MKTLLVQTTSSEFRITIPEDAKVTFGPWSPPKTDRDSYGGGQRSATGTLRIYQGSKENIIGCFSGVTGFRDVAMGYAQKVAVEEGATMWKDDAHGYVRESKVSRQEQWIDAQVSLPASHPAPKKKKPAARKR